MTTKPEPDTEPVWTFRGYQLRAGDFTTAMVHFFRAEISRANVWRQRLDTTTNWAVVTTAAAISFAFTDPSGESSVILLTTFLVTLFLAIEARRYRYYELWSSRVRLMETDFFASMLVPPFRPSADWAESLAESLLQPHFSISMLEAIGRRIRRNYLWIYVILGLSWFAKLWLQPEVATSFEELLARATIGPIPGWVVILVGLVYNGIVVLLGLLTLGLHEASGEVLPRYGFAMRNLGGAGAIGGQKGGWQAWFRPSGRRQQLMALIITDSPKVVADRVLAEMKRGITSLSGTGMYTGQAHSVLMCALTATEVNQLKTLVNEEDPHAFMIVSPVQEVLGRGFSPLTREK